MSKYIELPVDQIELDKSNPRIANFLATHDEDDITSELMALLLGTTSDACASLRQSIEANYGIIHPIIVNKRANGTYVVIEGNTRLQIYKDLRRENKPGNWDTIRSKEWNRLYDDLGEEKVSFINLIGDNEYLPDKVLGIRPDTQRKLHLHYLTTPRLIALSGMIDKDSPTYSGLYEYITVGFPQFYEDILDLVCESESQQQYIFKNFVYFFGKNGVTDVLTRISKIDFSVDRQLKKWHAECKKSGIAYIDFELIRIYCRYVDLGVLSSSDHEKCYQAILKMNMNELATILQGNLNSFSSRIGENLNQEKGQAILKLAAKSIVSNIQMRLSSRYNY